MTSKPTASVELTSSIEDEEELHEQNSYETNSSGGGDTFDDYNGMEDFNDDEADAESSDPEHFDFECFSLDKIDWIMESKCERIVHHLKLDDLMDALAVLNQFKWNAQKVIDLYEQDKQTFLQTYFSDNNNNKSTSQIDRQADSLSRTKLVSYVNIFDSESKLFAAIKANGESNEKQVSLGLLSKRFDTYCDICCVNKLNVELDMAAAITECSHYFCRECWRIHFESLINESFSNTFAATSKAFQCMQTKCKAVASKDFVLDCLKYNMNNNEDSCSMGADTVPLWRKPFVSGGSKNLSDRYRQLVAMDLIRESEDIQLCPGDVVIQEKQTLTFSTGSPSFSSFLLNNVGTPTTSTRPSSYINSKVLSSATVSQEHKSHVLFSSSYPSTSHLIQHKSTPTSTASFSQLTRKCTSIVWIKSKSASRRVTCSSCQTKYCFICLLSYHAPNSCQTIKNWLSKCQDDSETRNYLLVHTQDCPKCRVRIEKNGGCSHMTCNRCKHEFCWVCANDWKTHGATYECNRYKGNPEQDNAREALNRYTHYYHRWINHSNSLKFETAFKEQCQVRIQEKIMNKEGGTLVDWEFLTEAVDSLTRARYTLQYTYPYAYYLEDNEAKLLFENIQAELERDVENLSHSLEKVTLNDKFNIKSQMNIVEKRRKTLIKDFIN